MKDAVKFLAGFSLGVFAGMVGGVLYAPASGKKTRRRIRTEADNLKDDLQDLSKEELKHLKKIINESVDEYTAKGKKSLDDIKSKVRISK